MRSSRSTSCCLFDSWPSRPSAFTRNSSSRSRCFLTRSLSDSRSFSRRDSCNCSQMTVWVYYNKSTFFGIKQLDANRKCTWEKPYNNCGASYPENEKTLPTHKKNQKQQRVSKFTWRSSTLVSRTALLPAASVFSARAWINSRWTSSSEFSKACLCKKVTTAQTLKLTAKRKRMR